MPIDWAMIYYGIENHIFDINIASEYACRLLEYRNQISDEELELIWNSNNRLEVLEMIEKIFDHQGNTEENNHRAKDKIRVAIIIYLRKTIKDKEKLLEQIEKIYADFGYPEDMEKFIIYMPSCDEYIPENHTIEDNRNHLISSLDDFIKKQQEKYQLLEIV